MIDRSYIGRQETLHKCLCNRIRPFFSEGQNYIEN